MISLDERKKQLIIGLAPYINKKYNFETFTDKQKRN